MNLSEFDLDIRHIAGADNHMADCLSRIYPPAPPKATISSVNVNPSILSDVSIADEQAKETFQAELEELKRMPDLRIEKIPVNGSSLQVWSDTSSDVPRPILPSPLRRAAFDTLHGLSHPSIKESVRQMTGRFIWKGIKKDSTEWARMCTACQRSKVQRHEKTEPQKYLPCEKFDTVHVDLVGPLPESGGYRYLFTAVDRGSRWPVAIPIANTSAAECAKTFLTFWVAHYGIPLSIVSDRGSQFTSSIWQELGNLLGCKLRQSPAYHPATNGLVERFHRSLKAALMARCTSSAYWSQELPWVLLGLRTAVRDDIGVSPAELLYGTTLSIPGHCLTRSTEPQQPILAEFLKFAELCPLSTSHNAKPVLFSYDLDHSSHVWLRRLHTAPPLTPPYTGPFQIVNLNASTATIQTPKGPEVVARDRLKPAHLPSLPITSQSGRVIVPPPRFRDPA